MFASSLLAASSLLLLATAQADSSSFSSALADAEANSPYSKFFDDANALLASATGPDAAKLNAVYSWQATETAVPSDTIDDQYQDYLNAYMTTTSAPLPAWVTAIPSSLQPVITSFLRAEGNLVAQDIAPIVSQDNAAWSAAVSAQATTSLSDTTVSTPAPSATASSGFAINSANKTMSGTGAAAPISANGTTTAPIATFATATGSATKSVSPPPKPKQQTTSGAEKPAGVALVAAIVGIMGMMILL